MINHNEAFPNYTYFNLVEIKSLLSNYNYTVELVSVKVKLVYVKGFTEYSSLINCVVFSS